jgi:hypothetical protein
MYYQHTVPLKCLIEDKKKNSMKSNGCSRCCYEKQFKLI